MVVDLVLRRKRLDLAERAAGRRHRDCHVASSPLPLAAARRREDDADDDPGERRPRRPTIAQRGTALRPPPDFVSRRFGAWTGGRGVFLLATHPTAYGVPVCVRAVRLRRPNASRARDRAGYELSPELGRLVDGDERLRGPGLAGVLGDGASRRHARERTRLRSTFGLVRAALSGLARLGRCGARYPRLPGMVRGGVCVVAR